MLRLSESIRTTFSAHFNLPISVSLYSQLSIIFTMSYWWVLRRGMNITKQFLTRHIFFKLFSLNCFWRVRNIYVPSWFSSSETVCFWASEIFKFIQLACDASENYQIYFLQTALSSNCFWCQKHSCFKFIFLFLTR